MTNPNMGDVHCHPKCINQWRENFLACIVNEQSCGDVANCFTTTPELVINGQEFTYLNDFVSCLRHWKIGFSNLSIKVNDVVGSESAETVIWQANGVHDGIYLGMLPTKKEVQFSGIFVFKYQEEKISSVHLCWDAASVSNTLKLTSDKRYTTNDFSNDFSGPGKRIYEFILNSRPYSCGIDQIVANAFRNAANRVPLGYELPVTPIEDALQTDIVAREVFLDTATHKMRALLYQHTAQGSENKPLLLYLHGGGWVMLSPENYDLPCRKLALQADINILSIDYRLLPEHAFTAPFEDCVNAYRWLVKGGMTTWSLAPTKLLIGGDSAGGTMAAGVVLKMQDEQVKLPDAALLFSPVMDMEFEKYPSFQTMGRDNLFLSAGIGGFQRGLYLPYQEWRNPYYSPMYADVSCFPPTFISAGGDDPLIDDNKTFAEKLKNAGVTTEFFVAEGMPHDFQIFLGLSPDVEFVYAAIAGFVTRL